MEPDIEDLVRRIVDLPRHQRLMLMRLLVDLDQSASDREIDKAWDEEIRARVRAVDEGRVTGISYEDIKREMSARTPPR